MSPWKILAAFGYDDTLKLPTPEVLHIVYTFIQYELVYKYMHISFVHTNDSLYSLMCQL
jgi:hypothetical protein